MNDQERLDDLLARSQAHQAALREIVQRLFPPDERPSAAARACEAFEAFYSAIAPNLTHRTDRGMQTAMHEIERIFRAPENPPKSDAIEDQ